MLRAYVQVMRLRFQNPAYRLARHHSLFHKGFRAVGTRNRCLGPKVVRAWTHARPWDPAYRTDRVPTDRRFGRVVARRVGRGALLRLRHRDVVRSPASAVCRRRPGETATTAARRASCAVCAQRYDLKSSRVTTALAPGSRFKHPPNTARTIGGIGGVGKRRGCADKGRQVFYGERDLPLSPTARWNRR